MKELNINFDYEIEEENKLDDWNRNKNSLILIDKKGIIKVDKIINDNEEIIIKRRKRNLTDKQKNFLNQSDDFKNHCRSLGGDIHMIYYKNEIVFNDINIDKANISRIMYLATFVDYNDKKEGLLTTKGSSYKSVPMDRKKMKELLNLGDTAFKSFLKNCKDNELIYEVDKKFYINPIYFNKGNVDLLSDDKGYCRLFINTIRELYINCKPSQHKTLTNIYQLIPFIHYSNNMICHNPECLENEAKPMNLKDIGIKLKIENNRTNLNRLTKELEKFKVTVEDKEYKLFAYVKVSDKDFFFINPYVIYSGNNVEQLRKISDTYFFRD